MIQTKICHYCQTKIKAKTYTQRFTAWGIHLKTNHYRNWGT